MPVLWEGAEVKPRLLDLFCGAGGAAMGYSRAGFEVVGVDIKPQPRYPFEFVQDDALAFLDGMVEDGGCELFSAIHASPPCQAYCTMANRYPARKAEHPALIPKVRDLLQQTGLPWVIENVEGARAELRSPVRICGAAVGQWRLKRHRLFESNVALMVPSCCCRTALVVGVYGDRPDGRLLNSRTNGTGQRAAKGLNDGQDAMGIDWMEWDELREAIPPAYTELIGHQLLAHIKAKEAA